MSNIIVKKNDSTYRWIVFLHGWGQNKESWWPLMIKCESVANCAALDLCGFGDNPLRQPFSISDYIEDIHKILQENGITPDLFIGHSFGGKLTHFYQEKYGAGPVIYLAPSLWKPRFSLRKQGRIYGYKLCRYLKNKGLIKKIPRIYKGSTDYQNSQGFLKDTFLRVVNVYPNKEIEKFAKTSYLFWGKKDEAISRWQYKKIYKILGPSHCYEIMGGHFAFLRHGDNIAELARNIIGEITHGNT